MRVSVRDERNFEIGWFEDKGRMIYYHVWKYGLVGQYDKTIKLYTRWKPIPGRVNPGPGTGDFGESDIRYWGT